MVQSLTVIGPVAKRKKFVFAKLESAEDLRLDYDVTLLPPKKEFFPPSQDMVRFEKDKYEGCISPQEKILLGVHFYDIKAIDMTDRLFREKNEDWNYLANREAATIIGSNIQTISERAFWGTVGKDVPPKGHDGFITKINGGYVYETRGDKGEALVKFGSFAKATDAQVKEARAVNENVMGKCPEKLNRSSKEIAEKVRKAFSKEAFWEALAEDCFSCGSCNIVCPTCYCFDVQDNWNLDQVSGARTRYWDACLTEDFAKVSLGGGATENFREERAERFRHRIMRKASYLNEKLGGPACVGCGRCSAACTSDIADPVNVINKIMEA
jgi:formate hydrogenlyase subunit 6/NADH:ubiquinone oxidoreductase subunit I